MRRTTYTHDTPAIEISKTEASTCTCIKVHPEEEKELDCPDSYDTLMRVFEWGKVSYRCENCGLTNPPLLSTMFEEHEIR